MNFNSILKKLRNENKITQKQISEYLEISIRAYHKFLSIIFRYFFGEFMNFNSILKKLRNENKITQKQISEYLEISIRAYQQYETGTRYPAFHGLIKIADYFDVSIDYLVGRTDKKEINK